MRWEYKTVKISALSFWKGVDFDENELTDSMNNLGQDEWELVSSFDTNDLPGNSLHLVFVFKRPLTE